MTKAKQSTQDRLRRLSECCCPVHGASMSQVGNTVVNGKDRFLAKCTRRDCNIKATTHEPHGPLVLLPEFEHLLKPSVGV